MSEQAETAEGFKSPRLGTLPATIEWTGGDAGELRLLEQTLLPGRVEVLVCRSVEDVWDAIRRLCVRGAPAIGVTSAFGLCLGTRASRDDTAAVFRSKLRAVGDYLCSSRPTAVNLSWAVERAIRAVADCREDQSRRLWRVLEHEACAIAREDVETCRRIGQAGADLLRDGCGVITHCNAGSLATAGSGTALAILYAAYDRGVRFSVFADETRPLFQGARLTALELSSVGIDVTVLCDNAAASLMARGQVQIAIVGADRIAANGDVANKIGTYSLAVAARYHEIPFYVAAPRSTFDISIADGSGIPIEARSPAEVRCGPSGDQVPADVECLNPAFDVTPAKLITGIVYEDGVVCSPSTEKIQKIFERRG